MHAPTKRWCIYCPIFSVVQYPENGDSQLLLNERQKFKPIVQTSDLIASSSSMYGLPTNHWITWAIFFSVIMLKPAFLLKKGTGNFPSTSASAGYKLIVSNRSFMVSRKGYSTRSFYSKNNFSFIINITYLLHEAESFLISWPILN